MKSLKNVAVFSTGTFKGKTYTLDDLNEMVSVSKSIKYSPRIGLTHNRQKFVSSYGLAKNFKVDGNLVRADLEEIPDNVFEAIDKGYFPSKSIKLAHNIPLQSGKVVKNLITSVDLLGNEIPALFEIEDVAEKFSLEEDGEEISIDEFSLIEFIEEKGDQMPKGIGEVDTDGAGKTPDVNTPDANDKTDNPVTPDVKAVVEIPTQSSFNLEDIVKSVTQQVTEKLQSQFSLVDGMTEKVKKMEKSKVIESDKLFIRSLTEKANPQLLPKDVKIVTELFNLLSDDEVIDLPNTSCFHLSKIDDEQTSFSLSENLSPKDIVKRFLNEILPERSDYSLDEYIEEVDGVKVTSHDLESAGGDLDGAKLLKKAHKIAGEKGLKTDTQEELEHVLHLARIS